MSAWLSASEFDALRLSLLVAACSALVSLVPGVLLGWLLARKRFPGRLLLDTIIHLPLVLPPVVVGYVLLLLLGRNTALGSWFSRSLGIELAFTWKAAVIASAVMAFPLLVRAVRLAVTLSDQGLEQAAATLGAGRITTFFTITCPLALPGIVTGMVLCFARSLGEFGATITFAGNIEGETRTLPLALYAAAHTPDGDPVALRLTLVCIVISLIALAASELLARAAARRVGSQP